MSIFPGRSIAQMLAVVFMRCEDRLEIFRHWNLKPEVIKVIGMKSSNKKESVQIPLVRLSYVLCKSVYKIERSSQGQTIILPFFDSCSLTTVAWDHLLASIVSNTLHVSFHALPSKDSRIRTEMVILFVGNENRLDKNGRFVSHAHSTFKSINNNMTMSTLCTLLPFSVPFFENKHDCHSSSTNPFALPGKFQAFIILLYFWPDDRLDTEEELKVVQSLTTSFYFGNLILLSRKYTTSAADYIRHIGRKQNVVDLPNGNRLM